VRLSRVYLDAPLQSGSRATLTGSAAAHLTRVLRLKAGDPFMLFNGGAREFEATLGQAHAGTVTVEVGAAREVDRESPLPLTLVQGVSRSERMDLTVQKATELGVTRLVPVLTERSVVKLDAAQAARKLEHWRAIAIAACEQSGRNRPPEVLPPVTYREFISSQLEIATRLLLAPLAPLRIADVPRPAAGVMVLIGPEGGLSAPEQAQALEAGFIGVRLGPRVLRTETAALAALTLLQREFGDF
jgi:16S rRNA (uracil1498-N3)-methyltransferase